MSVAVLPRSGARIAYDDTGGDGSPVLLIHGAGMSHAVWDHTGPALAEAGFRVVASDLRGHGDSVIEPPTSFTAEDARDDLLALMDALELSSAFVVGHSLGGNLGQELAVRHSSRVRGLVVVDAAWNAGPLSVLARFGLWLATPALALIPARRLPAMMARASAETAAGRERCAEVFADMPKSRFIEVWRATAGLIHPNPSTRLSMPLALVRGAVDRTGTIASSMPRWAQQAGVREELVAGAGHVPMWDAAGETTNILIRVLTRWRASD